MVNKKHLLLVGLCSALGAQPVFAQESQSTPQNSAQWSARDMTYRGQNYDVLDTAYVPKKSMAQHKKFLNHQYAFPARPRNMWEVGFGLGQPIVMSGSTPPSLFFQKDGGYGFNLNVRKSWGYLFSTRLQYAYNMAKGVSTDANTNFGANKIWQNAGFTPGTNVIYNNFHMESHQINLDFMLSTNNLKFNKARTGVSFYGYFGVGALSYLTWEGVPTDPTQFTTGMSRSAILDATKNGYHPRAATQSKGGSTTNSRVTDFAPSVGVGAQFRINKRVNLQLEERLMYPNGDGYLDGVNYESNAPIDNTVSIPNRASDILSYTSIGLNFNLGNKKKRVEPLYWLNPLDFSYNELNYPRHMLLPDPVLPDADGDGVTDQFDKCPGTPAGVSVDAHGCPMDTDGDGVPDFRDKQLITPTECQPVDADGVGKCPCPEGCGTAKTGSQCGNIGAGSIIFPTTSAKISSAMQSQLATLAAQMMANPDCHVVITGAGNGNKLQQQRSWDRVNSVIQYMSEKNGINRNRFIFQYGQSGDANVVMYRSANVGEEGPVNVPPPFPNLKTGEK